MLRAMWFVALLTPTLARAEPPRVTLAQVVRAARQDPPVVLTALASLERSERELHQARGAMLPTLGAQVSGGFDHTNQRLTVTGLQGLDTDGDGMVDAVESSSNVSELDQVRGRIAGQASADLALFDLARRRRIEAAEGRREAAGEDAQDAQLGAVAAAVELYVRALTAEQLVDNAQATEARRRKQHEAIQGLVSAGLRPGVDAVRTEVQATTARYALAQRRIQRQRSYAALARAIGRDPEQGVAPVPMEQLALDVPADPRAAVQLALAHRPDLHSLKASVRAQENEMRAALMRRVPVLGVQASAQVTRTDLIKSDVPNSNEGTTFTATGILYLRWDGLDASVIRSGSTARARLMEARRQLDSVLLDVRGQVVDAFFDVESARRENERAGEVLDGAERTLEAQTHRYEAGAASLLDLLDAENLAQTAQVDAITSQRDLTLARLLLLTRCGTLDERLGG